MQLYKAEVPSPVPDKLKPRIRDTAMILWKVYALISLVEVILLMLGGMGLYDALCHTFTTMPTGGFSTKNTSVAHYDSVYFDCVFIFFMLLAGINFSLHYQMIRGKTAGVLAGFGMPILSRGGCIVLIIVVSLDVFRTVYDTLGDALRYGAFQVVSIITTTGYATSRLRAVARHVPASFAVVHVSGCICRFHRRRHEMSADHAVLQILL